jgi:opacity protein-like surface antigen
MVHMKRFALALAAVAILPAGQVVAADYDPPISVEPAEEYVPVEIGSAWYLRGDIAYNFARDYGSSDSNRGAWLTGNPFTVGPYDLFDKDDDKDLVSGSIGFGYHFNDYLRADVNVGILTSQKYNASAEFDAIVPYVVDVDVKNTSWNGMVNGYIDLGTYAGLTPYVGAGIGAMYMKSELEGEASDRKSSYNFMYGLAAGVSYQVTKNTSIDVGYQYLNAPNVEYYAIGDNAVEVREGWSTNQIKVGLRYDLW